MFGPFDEKACYTAWLPEGLLLALRDIMNWECSSEVKQFAMEYVINAWLFE